MESIEAISDVCIVSNKYEYVNNLFERALVYMHKMPRIWLIYSQFLDKQHLITKTRNLFDRALASLPISQVKI